MPLTNNDLKKIDAIAEKRADDMVAQLVPYFGKIEGTLNDHTGTLNDHTGTLNDHTERLDRLEQYQKMMLGLVDRHDKQVSRIERELKLPPLPR